MCNYKLENMHIFACCKDTVKRWRMDHVEEHAEASKAASLRFSYWYSGGNLGKILFSSLARLQQIAGLTQCDIYF